MKFKIRRMTREILEFAEDEGLCDSTLLERLTLRMANRKGASNGGKTRGAPWMSIALRSIGWDNKKTANAAEMVTRWRKYPVFGMPTSPAKRARNIRRWERAAAGESFWGEYASIAEDPEIGDLYGDPDDTDLPLAALLTHELAHVIDYNCGSLEIAGRKYGPAGTGHGKKWRAIYRVLRNGYVASGKYKTKPALILPFKPKPIEDMRLVGLPLFDLAA